MKKKFSKIMGVGLTVMLLASLTIGLAATPVAAADAGWTRIAPPSIIGGRVLTTVGATLGPLGQAIDGTLYAYDNSGTGNKDVYKSTDGGRTWAVTGYNFAGAVVAIATSPSEANVVYVATAANIYKSTDAGASFVTLAAAPVGHAIASLDAARLNGTYMVVVGTTVANIADVFVINEADAFPAWTNMGFNAAMATAVDTVVAVAFSPNFLLDRGIVAIGTDVGAPATYGSAKFGGAAWGGTIGNPAALAYACTAGDIAFPSDFNFATNPNFFFGINDAAAVAGGVYLFQGVAPPAASVTTLISAAAQIATLDVSGSVMAATIVAGTTGGTVLRSLNGGASWSPVLKQPTGTGTAFVALKYDDATQAYTLVDDTPTAEGGLSLSVDSGATWNQISLIATTIANINDLSIASDGTIFMNTTAAVNDSIWRYASSWERVYCSTTYAAADLVEVSPDGSAVFAANLGGTAIYRSVNNGQSWTVQTTAVGASIGAADAIRGWVVIDSLTIITGGAAKVCRTTNNGLSWTEPAVTGTGNVVNLALQPGYNGTTINDILAGDSTGDVALSTNGGVVWGAGSATGMGAGNVFPAFDASYDTNSTYYATSAAAGALPDRVMRKVGVAAWAQIDAQGQAGEFPVTLGRGLVAGSDGTLYAASFTAGKGMFRTLNPTATVSAVTVNPYWELANNYAATVVLTTQTFNGLWLTEGSSKLWALDPAGLDMGIYHYTDTLSAQVVLDAPAEGATLTTTTTATPTWTALSGATAYQIQVNTRADFSAVTAVGTYTYFVWDLLTCRVTVLTAGTKYYWRVRVASAAGLGAPVRSHWSDASSFTTNVAAPGVAVSRTPANGATGIIITPNFAWAAVVGATVYQLELTTDPGFDIITEGSVLDIPAAQPYCVWSTELEYSTSYYWRVRAATATGNSVWITSVFTTRTAPAEPPPPPPEEWISPYTGQKFTSEAALLAHIAKWEADHAPVIVEEATPGYIWAIIGVAAVLVVAVLVLIVRTRRPV